MPLCIRFSAARFKLNRSQLWIRKRQTEFKNTEVACPPSGAQHPSRVGRRRVGSLPIASHDPVGEPRPATPSRRFASLPEAPKLTSADRLLWTWLCDVWSDWRSASVAPLRH